MRTKITTTIEEGLLNHAKSLAKEQGFDGVNAIVEKALELYFSSELPDEIWEKSLPSGWIKKLVVSRNVIIIENIKYRKAFKNHKKDDYTHEALQSRGWKRMSN